jgi:hypothetical protein
VQERGESRLALLRFGESEAVCEQARIERGAPRMAAHARVLRLDRVCEHLEERERALRLGRRRSELAHRPREDLGEPIAHAGIRFDLVEDLGDLHVAADHVGQLFEEVDHAAATAAARERAVDGRGDLDHVERLLEVVADAEPDGVGRGVEAPVAGDDDHLDVREVDADGAHQLMAAQAGHREVERHDVHGARVQDLERLGAAAGEHHVVGRGKGSCGAIRAAPARRRR